MTRISKFFVYGILCLGLALSLYVNIQHKYIMQREVQVNIFFLETSHADHLTTRQACSIESAALNNPSAKVSIFMNGMKTHSHLRETLQSHYDVHFHNLDPKDMLQNSPLEDFYERKDFINNSRNNLYENEALKIAALWKFGGIFLDFDILVTKPLTNMRNFLVWENPTHISNTAMSFKRSHLFLLEMMREFERTYNAKGFADDGLSLWTRVFNDFCARGCDVQTFPREKFMPIDYQSWKMLFENTKTNDVMHAVMNSLAVRVWNKFSLERNVVKESDSAYERLAKRNCPQIYNLVLDYF